jgi:TetR/AcrR family transcriptional regulator, tetracycline repressor protein
MTKAMTRRVKSELSRDAIVQRALAIADKEGLEAVTIRRIAQDFDVTPMALYWHVRNKDELLAAMGDSFFDGISAGLPYPGSWDRQLRAVIQVLIAALRHHPAAAPLALPRVLECDDGRALAEYTLGFLRDVGFSVPEAADTARTGLQTAIMLVVQHPGLEVQVPASERGAILADKRAALRGLQPERYPRLVEAADALTDCEDADAYFAFGTEMVVAGARALQRRRS